MPCSPMTARPFLEELPGNYVKELLKTLTPERRAETLELLGMKKGR
jgi:hypothetical protein